MYDYSPETCLIKDVDGQLYNIIDLWRGIKQPVDPSTIKKAYAPRTCLVENIDGTTVNIIDTILTVANGSGAGTSCLQEVIQARNEYKTLDERLDTENMKIYETLNSKDYLPFKGEYITVPHSKIGYTKGLKIQGKTYQNLSIFPKSFILNQSKRQYIYPITLKTNTDYTIIVNIKKYTQGTNSTNPGVYFLFRGSETPTIYNSITESVATGKKMRKFSITTPISDIGIYIQQSQAEGGTVVEIEDIMVLEGDYTTPGKYIPPYFEGIKSVGEEENNKIDILSTGKNLFNIQESEKISDNSVKYKDGLIEFLQNDKRFYIGKNIFKKNTRYTISYENVSGLGKFTIEYTDGTTGASGGINPFTTEINKTVYAIRNTWIDDTKVIIKNLQLEEGTQATPYEPYQGYNKETLLPYNYGLKGLSDTVYDEIVDNKVIQRVGRVVLNGSESVSIEMISNYNTSNTLCFAFTVQDKKSCSGQYNSFNGTCTHFSGGDWYSVYNSKVDKEMISETVDQSYKVYIKINKNRLETQNVQGFKKWLQTHPVTVYYELAEPVEHKLPIDNREMKTYDGITHISSSNAINPYLDCQAPSNPQAVVADLMVANESLSNELDVKTKELQAKDEHLMNENDLLTAKDLDMDFRIFELEEQLTPEVAKLSLSHNSPYLMIERCIEKGLYEKEDMLYKMGRYLHGKRLTQEEYDKLKLMMG